MTPARAWAAFSAWRGDPPLLAQALVVAIRAIGERYGRVPSCDVVVRVPGTRGGPGGERLIDEEQFDSPEALAKGPTPQALRRWTEATAVVKGEQHTATIVLCRRPPWKLRGEGAAKEGVTVTVEGPHARQVLAPIAASVSRGGFRKSREPESGEDGSGPDAARDRLAARRAKAIWGYALFVGLCIGVLAAALGWVVAKAIDEDAGAAAIVVAAAVALVAVLAARHTLFPAVEIATVTPGRRFARLATSGLGASTVVSLLLQQLLG